MNQLYHAVVKNKKQQIIYKHYLDNAMYSCICGKSYTTKKGLRYHQIKYCKKLKSTNIKTHDNFICRKCMRSFTTLKGLNYHKYKYCKGNKSTIIINI